MTRKIASGSDQRSAFIAAILVRAPAAPGSGDRGSARAAAVPSPRQRAPRTCRTACPRDRPCVPRNSSAPWPSSSAAAHSISSYVALIASTMQTTRNASIASPAHVSTAHQDLARGYRRHEALEEVADLVVRIAVQAERVGDLEAERHARVCVGAADHEHHRVQENADIEQRRQRKAIVRRPENRQHERDRRHFERPRRAIVRLESGQPQQSKQEGQRDQQPACPHRAIAAAMPANFCRTASR